MFRLNGNKQKTMTETIRYGAYLVFFQEIFGFSVFSVCFGLFQLFWAQMALASLLPFQGPKKSRFSGPTHSNAPRNDVAPLKTIKYRAIKTTGTLIVNTIPQGDPTVPISGRGEGPRFESPAPSLPVCLEKPHFYN
jgi:hypothetical protein